MIIDIELNRINIPPSLIIPDHNRYPSPHPWLYLLLNKDDYFVNLKILSSVGITSIGLCVCVCLFVGVSWGVDCNIAKHRFNIMLTNNNTIYYKRKEHNSLKK